MVNHFLPGLRCLRADMEQLSPEHEVRRRTDMRSHACNARMHRTDGPDCLPLSIRYSQKISHNISEDRQSDNAF